MPDLRFEVWGAGHRNSQGVAPPFWPTSRSVLHILVWPGEMITMESTLNSDSSAGVNRPPALPEEGRSPSCLERQLLSFMAAPCQICFKELLVNTGTARNGVSLDCRHLRCECSPQSAEEKL
eukprot:1924863-Amphidinium_carterae.1